MTSNASELRQYRGPSRKEEDLNSRLIKIALIIATSLSLLAGGVTLARQFKDSWDNQGTKGHQRELN
jgi:hypothetical protein